MTDPYTASPEADALESGSVAAGFDASRLEPGVTNVRSHVARGTIVNAAFQVGLSGLGLLQRLAAAAFLTRAEFGFWGAILTSLVTLSWLKDIGVADRYIQQSEPDQEAAFQKAFTVELCASMGFFLLVVLVLPIYALAYGQPDMIVPGVVAALVVPITAFEAPSWIPYRRLQYVRQRVLTGVNPVLTTIVTIALAAAGAGYWCFIGGALAGCIASAVVCTTTCPYRLRLRLDRGTLRDYASFSLPLLGAGVSGLIVIQGSLLVVNTQAGLAGIGAIGLAIGFAAFADKIDTIVSQTIYPAVCAAATAPKLLFEAFVKSNRLALMWAMPFGVGLALFATDLVRFVLGERWEPAIGLIAATGITCAFAQVAFNWTVFLRAVNRTQPILVGALLNLAVFAIVSVPAMLLLGLTGWAVGFAATTLVQIAARGYYMSRLFDGFRVLGQLARALLPTLPAAAVILALRAVAPSDRTPGRAIAELALYAIVVLACTLLFERRLIAEVIGYVRRRARA